MNVIVDEYEPGVRVRATVDGVRVMAGFNLDGGVVWRCNRHRAKPYPHCPHTRALAAAKPPEKENQ